MSRKPNFSARVGYPRQKRWLSDQRLANSCCEPHRAARLGAASPTPRAHSHRVCPVKSAVSKLRGGHQELPGRRSSFRVASMKGCAGARAVWSNPSIERTSQRPLRALCAAAHVER